MAKRKMVQSNLIKNSIAAYFAAIEIHNNPNMLYRYETVTLLIMNAWELALKAYVKKYIKRRSIFTKDRHTISADKALDYVFGYTCANDITARDKQPAHGQWTYAKGFDTFCPLGPVIETAIADPEQLTLRGYLNGKLVQETSTSDHVFSVAEIIEFVSGCMTLLPGDVIITGTPAGIGPLVPGDQFAVEIEGIGILKNTVMRF